MERTNVYRLIDGEREYQESLPLHQDKKQQRNTPIASWLIYMEEQIREAKFAIYNLNGDGALEHIRKATAIGVACMEHNDTNPRKVLSQGKLHTYDGS